MSSNPYNPGIGRPGNGVDTYALAVDTDTTNKHRVLVNVTIEAGKPGKCEYSTLVEDADGRRYVAVDAQDATADAAILALVAEDMAGKITHDDACAHLVSIMQNNRAFFESIKA